MQQRIRWQQRPIVTWGLLGIQLFVFILMEIRGGSENAYTLLNFGAKENYLIASGEYFRLICPIFLHIGWMHLLLNSLTLYYVGALVENMIGHWRFLFIYFYAGLMGNIFSYQFSWHISAGASTALFGLFAFFVAKGRQYPSNRYYNHLAQQFKMLIIMNMVCNLFSTSVDIYGHLGGALGGFLATFLFSPTPRKGLDIQRLWSLGIYLGIVAFVIFNWGTFNQLIFQLFQ